MTPSKRARRLVAAATAAVVLTAGPAGADILIEFDELIFGQVGSVRTVAEADVPADLVGSSCEVSVLAENQASVHPGNDLIVATGETTTVIVGVEDEANGGTTEIFEVVVGPTIVVQLRFGPDEISSLGFDLSFDCDLPTTTTTIPSTTTVPDSTDPTLDGQNQGSTSTSIVGQVGSTTIVADGGTSTTDPNSGPTSSTVSTEASTTLPPAVTTTVPGANIGQGTAGTEATTTTTCAAAIQGGSSGTDAGTDAGANIGQGGADADGQSVTEADQSGATMAVATTGCPDDTPPPTEVSATDSTADLPPSPVAQAIVAAPAYAG